MSVLILADERDASADAMVHELTRREVVVWRLDTAWFPMTMTLSARLVAGRWAGSLRRSQHSVELNEIRAIWYRAPRSYRFGSGLNPAELDHARVEAKYGLGGVLMSLPVRWVNHPARLADSAYKPYQLVVAARCGLTVPETMITNDPMSVRHFVTEGESVTKMLGAVSLVEGGVRRFAHTAQVDARALADLRGVQATAHQFQRWVSKVHEVRVMVVGSHVVAVAIHAHSPSAHVDWRTGYESNTYAEIEPPPAVSSGVRQMATELGLLYGAFDFVVGPDDTWTFLEVNAGGQYGWLEAATEVPITSLLADILTGVFE